MRSVFWIVWIIVVIPVVGCGGSGSSNPAEPGGPQDTASQVSPHAAPVAQSNRYLWGLWKIRIDPDRTVAEVTPQRAAEMHLNCVRLLEVTPCTDCLTISNLVGYPPNELTADLTLRHPYPGNLKLTGFDVRGILITGADYTFPVSGRSIAWGDDLPRMLNADGYTSLFNPTEFPETNPPTLGYIPGKYSTGGDLSATLNPFVAYAKDAPRRMFEAGGMETRTVRLYVPDGPLEFGYAVDACWQLVDEVVDPVEDFPPDANCLEAYRIDVQVGSGLELSAGGMAEIFVEVHDHQGLDTISSVTVEAPELFGGEVALTLSTVTGEESWLFSGMITDEQGVVGEGYPLLVRVVDTWADQNLGAVDAWGVCGIDVVPKKGWARTWGGVDLDEGYGVAVDGSGNVYVTGHFRDTVDFDPGPGVDEHSSNGYTDVFISKFDSQGNFQWARTWGAEHGDGGMAVATDGWGNVYVTGCFHDSGDFDPGPGVDEHISNGYCDAFLSKFDSEGGFQWARTWGGISSDGGRGVAADGAGNIYVTGVFHDTVDFDPGPGVDEHSSNGYWDVFLSKFDSEGNFHWGRTWGGKGSEEGFGVAVDGSGSVYVTGHFWRTVDFDPGPGVDEHSSNGNYDAFLSKLDSEGDFQWARTWGGIPDDEGWGVAVDGSGKVYVTGYFWLTVDFDPGSGLDEHTSNGKWDVFLSKLDSGGDFQWARTWGGIDGDWSYGVAVDGSGGVYVTGHFYATVDFDPGPAVDGRSSNGSADVFLSKFDSAGDFQWARTWGRVSYDHSNEVAADGSGSAYVTGYFKGTVDFDPGPGVDEHSSNGFHDAFLSKFPPDGNW